MDVRGSVYGNSYLDSVEQLAAVASPVVDQVSPSLVVEAPEHPPLLVLHLGDNTQHTHVHGEIPSTVGSRSS